MAGGSVITDAGGKVGHPAIHRRFDNRLAELPLRMFQRRFGYADPALAAAEGGGGGIQGGIDVLKVFSRDGILRQASATASLAGGLALLRLRFRHLRLGFRQLRLGRSAPRCDRGVVDGKQYFPGFDPLVIGYVQLQNTAGDLRGDPNLLGAHFAVAGPG